MYKYRKVFLFQIIHWVLIMVIAFAFGHWLSDRALPEKVIDKPDEYYNPDWGTIDEPEEILFEFTAGGVLKDNFIPQVFLKITGTDLSRCFIDGRLRVDLNGEIYWIRLER